jgi:pyruvate/2-oxoglutarate dehydrogenase complex dihydrolipoamide acyltransferase (E2) component
VIVREARRRLGAHIKVGAMTALLRLTGGITPPPGARTARPVSRRARPPPLRAAAASAAAAAPPPPGPPPPRPPPREPKLSERAATIAPVRLRALRRAGLALDDVSKVGRLGASEGLAERVRARWNSSPVAKLRCSGRPAQDMAALTRALEAATGGAAVHRAGGTVFMAAPWAGERDAFNGPAWAPGPEDGAEGDAATIAGGGGGGAAPRE